MRPMKRYSCNACSEMSVRFASMVNSGMVSCRTLLFPECDDRKAHTGAQIHEAPWVWVQAVVRGQCKQLGLGIKGLLDQAATVTNER